MLPKYGPERLRLIFTDTDSICVEIHTDDVYKDIEPDNEEWFDSSDYPEDHMLYSTKNKKLPGFFKDELQGEVMRRGVVLKAKQYTFQSTDKNSSVKKVCKGVKKSCIDT